MKRSKRYISLLEKLPSDTDALPLRDAIEVAKSLATAKFDETIEVAVRLGVDPRKADQMVRGTVVLPNGTGRKVRVLVFAEGEKAKEAEEAGADYVGGDEYIEKIMNGWLDFDSVVATPDMMKKVGKLGRILGSRGLMPSPKSGTVTFDIGKTVDEIKKGKIAFRVDKEGNIHIPAGKASFDTDKIYENVLEFIKEVIRLKPASAKGTYIKSFHLSPTMGPSVKVDVNSVMASIR